MILESPTVYGDLPPKLLADFQFILRNSTHLSGLINDVLDLSQITADRMAIAKEPVDLGEVINSVAQAVRPLFESKNLTLEINMPVGLPQIMCDPTRIREVLLNLVSNAGRFTDQGGVKILVKFDKGEVAVNVCDTGPGMTKESLQRLFEPFQQGDGSIRHI